MPVNKDPRPPRSRQISNLLFLAGAVLLTLNIFLPNQRVPRTPYSMFIHQVQEQEVVKASVGQNEIRYQVKDELGDPGSVYSTVPPLNTGCFPWGTICVSRSLRRLSSWDSCWAKASATT